MNARVHQPQRPAVHSDQHAASYYAATANRQLSYPTLAGEELADVCIVGGGFSGLNTAIELARKGFSVVLLEAHLVGWGASGRNGGQLIRGVGHGVEQFEPVIGADGVRQLKLMGLEAVELVRRRVEEFQIDCDLTWGYCDLANKPAHLDGFAEDKAELESLGYRHELRLLQPQQMHQVVGSDRYCGGMIDMGSGHLHPLNLALGEAAAAASLGVRLFEHSPVSCIDYGPEVKVHTARGSVRAKTLVLACNAYLNGLDPELGGKVLPAGSCYPERCVAAFTASEVECLAILEHRRWLRERQRAGWRYGTAKDVERRRSPYMVPWEELPDRAKEWNRSAVRSIPSLLASVNLAVVK